MARTQEDTHIYGAVNSLEDLRRINPEIRHEMDAVTSQAQLTELKKLGRGNPRANCDRVRREWTL
jgi:hypothetical protein